MENSLLCLYTVLSKLTRQRQIILLLCLSLIILTFILQGRILSTKTASLFSAVVMIKDLVQLPVINTTPLLDILDISSNDGICNGTVFLKHSIKQDSWQPVDKDNKMFVFSAYYIQAQRKVFIIGAKPMYKVSVICQLWSNQNDKSFPKMWETDATVRTPNDPAGPLPYTAAIFECPLNENDFPTLVSLATKSCQNANNLLYIHNATEVGSYERRFTVCLAPIYSYGNAREFVEWMELNRILGVEKFMIYNYSVAPDLDRIIDYYSNQGLAEVIQWRLPFPVTHHIHYFGQTAALNDCLFRNKQFSEFISNIDLDEYIIPHSKKIFNWIQMIKRIGYGFDGYIFKNTFFRKEWENKRIAFKNKEKAKQLGLITLKHFEHEWKIYNYFDRSKYFARTARIYYTWIHNIPDASVAKVPTNEGLLHHYRNWQNYADKKNRIMDVTVLEKFGNTLIVNVEKVWKNLTLNIN